MWCPKKKKKLALLSQLYIVVYLANSFAVHLLDCSHFILGKGVFLFFKVSEVYNIAPPCFCDYSKMHLPIFIKI